MEFILGVMHFNDNFCTFPQPLIHHQTKKQIYIYEVSFLR